MNNIQFQQAFLSVLFDNLIYSTFVIRPHTLYVSIIDDTKGKSRLVIDNNLPTKEIKNKLLSIFHELSQESPTQRQIAFGVRLNSQKIRIPPNTKNEKKQIKKILSLIEQTYSYNSFFSLEVTLDDEFAKKRLTAYLSFVVESVI